MSIGKFKAIIDRQRGYMGMVNFIMIAYLFFDRTGFEWWYIFALPIWIVFVWLDVKYIMPKEYKFVWDNNPAFQQLKEDMK